MSSSAYQYLSDTGDIYQVFLPDDFAAVLGYVPAGPSEPYLPDWISPRYTTYQAVGANVFAAVAVTFPFRAGFPPQTITVGSQTYTLLSEYGEQRTPLALAGLRTIAGPQGQQGEAGATGATGPAGPAGAPGAVSVATGTLTNSQIINSHVTPVPLVAAPGSGKILVPLFVYLKLNYASPTMSPAEGSFIVMNNTTVMSLGNSALSGAANTWNMVTNTSVSTTTNLENQSIQFQLGGTPTAFGGTADYGILYQSIAA